MISNADAHISSIPVLYFFLWKVKMRCNLFPIELVLYDKESSIFQKGKRGIVMEEGKKLKQYLFIASTFGFAVFTMVVITEIVRMSIH